MLHDIDLHTLALVHHHHYNDHEHDDDADDDEDDADDGDGHYFAKDPGSGSTQSNLGLNLS